MHRHARCNLVQFAKTADPEILIEIEVAVIALRGAGVRDLKNVKVLPEDYATEDEARAAARAAFARTQRSQATFSYQRALGRPEVFPELPVNVAGLKPEINETPWLVKKATHTLGEAGLTTSLEMEVRDDPTTDKHRSHFRKST